MELEYETALASHGLVLIKLIGTGTYGKVYRVHCPKVSKDFAAKISSPNNCIKAEIKALSKLNHPNIVSLYDYFEKGNLVYLIMEFCPGGSIESKIRRSGPIPEYQITTIIKGITSALKYCHMNGCVHHDIKPGNILLDYDGTPKLCDFGLSSFVNPGEKVSTFVGSLPFLSPEKIKKYPFDPFASDLWSFGVTIYYMTTAFLPWKCSNEKEMIQNIMNKKIDISQIYNPKLREVIAGLIHLRPEKRITIEQMENLPYMRSELEPIQPGTRQRFLMNKNQNTVSTPGHIFQLSSKILFRRRDADVPHSLGAKATFL